MDPMSAIAIAGTAFNAIKAGFEHGREIEAMAGDVGRWMGAIKDVKDGANKKKKKMYGGTAMKDKKGMGGKMMKYKTGGFTLEPKTPNLDDL